VSVPAGVNDFYQMTVPWSNHDMLILSCHLERTQEVAKFTVLEDFEMLIKELAAELWDWRSVYFVTGINFKDDLFNSMLVHRMDTFAPKHLARVRAEDGMCGIRN
jgi:hypothetical protein